jgi:hypothetical protein
MRKLLCKSLILLSFIIGSCDKNTGEPDSQIIFKGITTTDIFGAFTGSYDSTDWRLDDIWQSKEKKLFADYDLYNYNYSSDSIIQIVGYPNPIVDFIFLLHLEKDSATRIDFRIVNQKFEKLISCDSLYGQEIAMTFKDIITENDRIVRIYYRFIKYDNSGFIGHGDILLK